MPLQSAYSDGFPTALFLHQECPYIKSPYKEKLLLSISALAKLAAGCQRSQQAAFYSTDVAGSSTAATDAVKLVLGCCDPIHTADALILALMNVCRQYFAQDCTAAKCILLYGGGTACRNSWAAEQEKNTTTGQALLCPRHHSSQSRSVVRMWCGMQDFS